MHKSTFLFYNVVHIFLNDCIFNTYFYTCHLRTELGSITEQTESVRIDVIKRNNDVISRSGMFWPSFRECFHREAAGKTALAKNWTEDMAKRQCILSLNLLFLPAINALVFSTRRSASYQVRTSLPSEKQQTLLNHITTPHSGVILEPSTAGQPYGMQQAATGPKPLTDLKNPSLAKLIKGTSGEQL